MGNGNIIPYQTKTSRSQLITQYSMNSLMKMKHCILSRSPSLPPKISDFVLGRIIGKGAFGKIREIQRKSDNKWFALKYYSVQGLSLSEAELIINEVTILKTIPSHKFMVSLHATFHDNESVSFVLDLIPGGDLRVLLRFGEVFSEAKAAYVIACIGSALHHIHLHRIIHRDVKPENIMFDGHGVPKLIDFGISYVVPESSPFCICKSRSGTSQYVSPETLVAHTHYHGYESDFWSLGIVMYELLFMELPFQKHVSSSLIKYSEQRYQLAWTALANDIMPPIFSGKDTNLTP